MVDQTLAGQVRQIMADTFGVDAGELPETPSQSNYARWTSILHMVLLVALEEQFGIVLTMDEMTSMTSLDRIVDVLGSRATIELPV
jgi:acyl carrier protein